MTSVSNDDECKVCGTKRDEHGDRNHKFSEDGQLIAIPTGPPPRNAPPQRASAGVERLSNDPVARLQIRLIERMVAKGLLDGEDMVYIFGGGSDSAGG